jgi:serine phosphatase RsbU (regulator of sigma subunit)/PAS domain-containing protein
MSTTPEHPSSGSTTALAVVLGLAVVGVLAGIDAASGHDTIVIGTVVLGPFLVSAFCGPRETALVAALAVILAAASATWNQNVDTGAYWLRLLVVVAGGGVSVVASRTRSRLDGARRRFALLVAIAEFNDGTLALGETAEQLAGLVVPAVADICAIDVVQDGSLHRLSVRVSGVSRESERGLRERPPSPVTAPGTSSAVDAGEPLLMAELSDARLQALAHDDADLTLLRSLGLTSFIAVPLRARGRAIGAMTVLVTQASGRRYRADDLEFAEVLAGRCALALDNAGLFTELETMEAQLTAALGSLDDAVTVQNPRGGLIYANDAAARLLEFDSPRQLIATPPREIAERFESFREDGSPLELADLPGRRVLAGEDAAQMILRSVSRQTGRESWRITKATAVRDRSGELRMVVNVFEDVTALKRAELTQRMLAQASDTLAASLDYERTLQAVAELAVPVLGAACIISLADERRQLRAVAIAHTDPDELATTLEIGRRFPGRLDDRARSAQLIPRERLGTDVEHVRLLQELDVRAAITAPLTSHRRSIGVITLYGSRSSRLLDAADLPLAAELGRRVGAAVESARLYRERSNTAFTLQRSLLPPRLPQLSRWHLATLYRAAGDENWVGGDFYDVCELESGWMALVGDVTGKGAQAAALTAQMRHTIRIAAKLTGSAEDALASLNRELLGAEPMAPCTAACAVLRDRADYAEADIYCAGHPLPLLVSRGTARYVGQFGPMLGAFDDLRWRPNTVRLDVGDVLVLYTDGVLDAVGEHDRFGPERLERAVESALDADDVVRRIEAALTSFEVGAQADDTAVLALQRTAVPLGDRDGDEDEDEQASASRDPS